MELKGALEEKVDHLFSDSDSKPEDLIKTVRKEISFFERKRLRNNLVKALNFNTLNLYQL